MGEKVVNKGVSSDKNLVGIKGWLLLFVVLLIIDFIGGIIAFARGVAVFPSLQGINLNLFLVSILSISILLFIEVVSLTLIFKKKQKAIEWVIVTLVYGIIYAAIRYGFIFRLSNWIFPVPAQGFWLSE